MASISTTSYVLDSRKRSAPSTVSSATYNMTALGSPVESGTYEMLSFNSRNNIYNVDDSNDEVYWDEAAGGELGPLLLPHGYYTSAQDLADAVATLMTNSSANTVTAVYDSLTNLNTFSIDGGSDFIFTWGDFPSAPKANLLIGFSAENSASSLSDQTSDIGTDLDPHSNLLISIVEDGLKNVTLVDGTEYSLIVPLDAPYGEEINGMKNQTFNQTVQFASQMNNLNVQLFTEDGVAVPELNASQYELIIRKLF